MTYPEAERKEVVLSMSNELVIRNSSALPVVAGENSLFSYFEKIKKFPVLSEEEEISLVKAFHERGDLTAAQKLVTSHLRLAKIGTKAAQKKLFYNLNRIKSRLGIYENRELEPDVVKKIAQELVVDEADVKEMNGRLSGDTSLNTTVSDEDETEKVDFIVDKSARSSEFAFECAAQFFDFQLFFRLRLFRFQVLLYHKRILN